MPWKLEEPAGEVEEERRRRMESRGKEIRGVRGQTLLEICITTPKERKGRGRARGRAG